MWLFGINGVVVMVSLFIIVLLCVVRFLAPCAHRRCCREPVRRLLYGAAHVSGHAHPHVSARLLGRRAHPRYLRERVGQRCLRLSYRLEVRQAQDDAAGLAEENLGRLLRPASSFPWRSGACSRSFLESR